MPPRARKPAPAATQADEESPIPAGHDEVTEHEQPLAEPATTGNDSAEDEPVDDDTEAHPPLCRECFPAGWPDDAYSAGCEHGSYLHTGRAAAIGN
jgi:hypothetical protein